MKERLPVIWPQWPSSSAHEATSTARCAVSGSSASAARHFEPVDHAHHAIEPAAARWVSECEPIRMRGPVLGLLPITVPMPSITGSRPASFMRSTSQ